MIVPTMESLINRITENAIKDDDTIGRKIGILRDSTEEERAKEEYVTISYCKIFFNTKVSLNAR